MNDSLNILGESTEIEVSPDESRDESLIVFRDDVCSRIDTLNESLRFLNVQISILLFLMFSLFFLELIKGLLKND